VGATAYPVTVASARVRVAGFVPYVRDHGIELLYRPSLADREYALLASDAAAPNKAMALVASGVRASSVRRGGALLLVHRLRLLTPLPWVDPPHRLDVYDLDDALFLGSAAPVNRRFQWAKREAQRSVSCMQRTRLVIAGNSFLAAYARRIAARVEVIPSCVDPFEQPLHDHAPAETVTIGWIGSPTTGPYLSHVLPAIARLNRAGPRARLVVVGADTGARESWIEHRPWSLERQPMELAGFDLGIMPLPDTEWARGKCGYKLLQYFSAGVPAIASPVGVTPEMVADGRGLLAVTTEDWYAALDGLVADVQERRERGKLARTYVEEHFSYQRWAPELAALLRSLA
jgi:glycosyltransferase involved in cell wall biosynthesis